MFVAVAAAMSAPAPARAQANQVDEEASDGDDDDDRAPPPSTPPGVSLGIDLGSMWLADRAGLASFAARASLGEMERFAVLVEPKAAVVLDRLVLPIRLRYATVSSDAGLDLSSLGGFVGAGYLMLRRADVSLYPSASFGVLKNELRLGKSDAAAGARSFDDLAGARGPAPLGSVTVLVEAAMDAAYRIAGKGPEGRGLFVGARVGLAAAVSQTPWSLEAQDDATLSSEGPAAPTSGPSFALSVSARY